MPTNIEYALMAGYAYFSTRDEINRFPLPFGWVAIPQDPEDSGFEASAFGNAETLAGSTEIVISYAGTDFDDKTGDVAADAALFAGLASEQLLQATEYYLQIKAINPDAKITLTGHSLGGGLASLVAVFFNETAVTFDQAPFRNAASWVRAQGVLLDLWAKFPASEYPAISTWLAPLERFIASFDPFGLGWSADGLDAREAKVTNLSVQGEFLSALNILRIGTELDPLTHGDYFGPLDLHSQALLTTFVRNDGFREVTFTLTDLLPMIFDENLFEKSLKSEDPNLLEHLLRHEAGGVEGVAETGDKMLARFTADLLKLAADTGLSISGSDLTKSLIAFAMQAYYSGRIATDISKQLYETISGGVRFDRSDISDDPDLNKIKGYVQYFQNHLATLPEIERALIQQKLPELLDWYLAGTRMSATAGDQSAFMLGAAEADSLRGSTQADLLVGLAGNDLLEGGDGDDTLIGGEGYDTYLWNTNDGADQIIDADRRGRILINGSSLGVLIKQTATTWTTADGKITLTQGDTWKLTIDGGGSLDLGTSFTDGDYGITLTEIATGGTLLKGDLDPILDGNGDLQYDVDGNVVVNAAIAALGRTDTLHGTAIADTIRALAGDDVIEAGGGSDLVEGGAGSDILGGQDGNDTIWAETALTSALPLTTALANGDTDASLTTKGDWTDGGAGNDLLIGSAAQDLLTGGIDNDLLIGGAGDDLLLGDATLQQASTDWSVTRSVETGNIYHYQIDQGATTSSDTLGGADVLHGGKGADWAFAGTGDDMVDGGSDDDVLFGDAGNDVLLGGSGADVINGDNANLPENLQGADWIDGGEGADRIFGMAGDDILIGGAGNDTIVGGAGRDTYIFNKGDGNDILIDDDTGPDKSILVFGAGVDPNSIKLRKGSLLLDLGDGDAIHIDNFNPNNPLVTQSFASFQFADGSSLSWSELLARGFDLDGTDGDDEILGTNTTDRIDGRAGNDLIAGLDGDDVLTGDTGTDTLAGGMGDDTYLLKAGDGAVGLDGNGNPLIETILDDGGDDTIRFTADVLPATLNLVADAGNFLSIHYGPSTGSGQADRVDIVNGLSGSIERIKVGAGDTARNLSYTQFVGEFGSGLYVGLDADNQLHLSGGNTDDSLYSASGNAIVSGGRGNDTLLVYGTGNTIHYSVGDGTDQVRTSLRTNAGNVLKLSGVTADDLRLGLGPQGELRLQVGADAVDSILLSTFDAANVMNWKAFDHIEFDDGSMLSYEALMAKGFDIVGTDQADTLTGTNVDDRVTGGAGDDVLEGGAGNDSYRFETGFGRDSIIDAHGGNAVEFGAGLSYSAMSVAQSLGDDGVLYLDLDFGNGDRLSIQTGELDKVQSFRFAPSAGSGQAGTMLTTGDLLATLPSVNLIGEDEADVLQGHAGGDLLIGHAGDDTLHGGAGNDVLNGGQGADVLQGGEGRDWLAGEAGDDQLAGGAGVDTYLFGPGSGKDRVIEASGEQSVLKLDVGATALSVHTARMGDDLVLTLDNGADAISIAGYYADAGTNWQVTTADDTTVAMADFIIAAGQMPQSVADVYAEYRDSVRGALATYLQGQGYRMAADGSGSYSSYSVSDLVMGTTIFSSYATLDFAFEAKTEVNFQNARDEWTGVQTTSVDSSLRRPVGMVERHDLSATGEQPYFVSRLAMLQSMRLSSIELPPGEPMPSAKQLLEMLSHLSKLNQPWSPPPGSTITEVIGKDGALAGVWVYPASNPDTGAFAETTTTTRITESGTRTIRIPELTLGAGNDSVTLYYHGMVDGGDGDDRLGAQFRIDASGYDSWSMPGGALLYGNDGNDYLSTSNQLANEDGDNILIGGRGRDVLIGGAGADTFMLLEENSVDYIIDLGSIGHRRSEWQIGVNHSNNPAIGGIAGNDHAALEPFYGSDILPDTLVFGAGVTAASLSVFMSDSPDEDQAPWLDQVLELLAPDGTGAQIVLARADDAAGTGIEYVAFADGTRLTIGQVLARLDWDQDVHGSELSDVIRTGAGNDRLDGGVGFNGADYDYLAGGAGNDVYVIGRYSGIDRIDQSTAGALDVDAIEFAADITADDVALSLEASGQIVFRIKGADGGAEVVGWPGDSSNLVVRFADGTQWDAVTIRNILKTIEGTPEADSLMGTDGSDIVLGYGGSDYLNAGDGDDTLIGGAGDDILLGGGGNDAYVFNRGDGADQISQYDAAQGDHDTIRFGADITPTEVTAGRNGSDLTLSLPDADGSITVAGWFEPGASQARLAAVEFADGTVWDAAALAVAAVIRGTEANDYLTGTNDGEILYGLAGDDGISAGAGDDTLSGGAGDDILLGGSGNDAYVFNRGDGADLIYQYDAAQGDYDTIRFGSDIAPAEVTVGRNGSDLTLSLPDAEGSITVAGWFEPGANQARLSAVEFADGTVWDQAALAAAAVMCGTEGDDYLAGTSDGDILHGLAGDDVIDAGDGDDTLIGGTGDDALWGGSGNDHYVFNRGDGQDVVDQSGAAPEDGDVVSFGNGIAPEDVDVSREGTNDLRLQLTGSTDSLTLRNWFGGQGARVAAIYFADGTDWTGDDLAQKIAGTAPVAVEVLPAQAGTEGREFRFVVPDAVFYDADPGDSLALSATLADGGALPGWLSFDALSREFSGTPGAGDTGVLALRLTATDSGGLSASTTFDLAIGQHLRGTASSDTLNYSAASFVGVTLIDGGLGNDAITGSAGSDIIVGGAGTDNLKGEAGDDVFLVSGTDAGHDRFEGGDGYDVIQGSAGDDTIRMYQFTGTATVERIEGNGGYDIVAGTSSSDTLDFSGTELVGIARIDGGLGNDAVTGSAGNDVIVGGAGTDNLKGEAGDDVFLVTGTDAGHDRFEGGDGYDVIQGSAGDDTIRMYQFTGTATVERIDGNGGYDIVAGTSSSDTLDFSGTELVGIALIDGGLGNDAITGSAGSDIIGGGAGTDNLKGEAGDDVFLVIGTDVGHDRFEGGDGYDVIQGSAGDDTIRIYQFTGTATVERIEGSGGYDIVAGTSSSDTLDFSATELVGIARIDGGLGNDAITGSAGNDVIVGGVGTDNLKGEAGDDIFLVSGTDAGHDRFEGGNGYDVIQGSAGDDTIRMYQFTGTATVERIEGSGGYDIVAGTSSSDTLDFSGTELVGIARIDGGLGNDAITGSAGNDVIVGGAGTDNLKGEAGDDIFLVSGTDGGHDRFEGGAGYDVVQGSVGDDTFRMYQFTGTATVERIEGSGGYDIVAGTSSSDTLDFSGTELVGIARIDGGLGNDAITGSAGNDIIVGGVGTDNLKGEAGDDVFLVSGTDAGHDRFEGGDGYDVIQGSAGDDTFRIYQYTGTATVEKIEGGGGFDVIAGTGSSDTLDFSGTELVGIARIDGGLGNDAITGSAGNDVIVGGVGTDRLTGGQGSDTYRLGRGDGADTIVENDATSGATDIAEFLAGIGREQIWLRHVGNNLEAGVIGTLDKLIVQNWYLGEQYRVEEFRTADGGLLLDAQVENLVQAMAAFAPPGAGQTTLPPAYQEALAPVIAANWQ